MNRLKLKEKEWNNFDKNKNYKDITELFIEGIKI